MKMLSTTTVVLPTRLIKVWSYFQMLGIEAWLTGCLLHLPVGSWQVVCVLVLEISFLWRHVTLRWALPILCEAPHPSGYQGALPVTQSSFWRLNFTQKKHSVACWCVVVGSFRSSVRGCQSRDGGSECSCYLVSAAYTSCCCCPVLGSDRPCKEG